MPPTKRAQILMKTGEYSQLKKIAREKKVSVGELIRRAVRERYLLEPPVDRRKIVEDICSMNLPIRGDWEDLEKEIEDAHIVDLP